MPPINVKMKLADPAEVDRLMKVALLESGWADAQLDARRNVLRPRDPHGAEPGRVHHHPGRQRHRRRVT